MKHLARLVFLETAKSCCMTQFYLPNWIVLCPTVWTVSHPNEVWNKMGWDGMGRYEGGVALLENRVVIFDITVGE